MMRRTMKTMTMTTKVAGMRSLLIIPLYQIIITTFRLARSISHSSSHS